VVLLASATPLRHSLPLKNSNKNNSACNVCTANIKKKNKSLMCTLFFHNNKIFYENLKLVTKNVINECVSS
jgi:hypothetical protein